MGCDLECGFTALRVGEMKIKGLDSFVRDMGQLEEALSALSGKIGAVDFDPHDAASIEAAIDQVAYLIDKRLQLWQSSSMVLDIAEQLIESFRQSTIERAAEERLRSQ